jgi:hypothetical protein
MSSFIVKTVNSWSEFLKAISEHKIKHQWIYRGHRCGKWELKSSLERELDAWGEDLRRAGDFEEEMIRDFKRRYAGDHTIIDRDTLHCLALMQHHFAPTRLLDWTYSPYVAAYFAIESVSTSGSIWCINSKWCERAAGEIVGDLTISERDRKRDEGSFKCLYMNSSIARKFVFTENPIHLNPRLIVQHGVFLCPGNLQVPFAENLKEMRESRDEKHILKLDLNLCVQDVREFSNNLRRMNVDAATLFPGLDGLGRSMRDRIPLYKAGWRM